jgi:outer membrane biosynthesis protein TonB
MPSRILHGAAYAAALLLPTGLLLQKAAAATTLTLAWQASASSPNIDGYRVYYGTSSGNYSQHVDVVGTATKATVSNAAAGSTYYYTVVAYKGSLESVRSNEVTSTTPAASPTPTPTPTPTLTPSPTPTPTPEPTPTPTPTNSDTNSKANPHFDSNSNAYADSNRNAAT